MTRLRVPDSDLEMAGHLAAEIQDGDDVFPRLQIDRPGVEKLIGRIRRGGAAVKKSAV
jgi:hypothetical protein